jgi:hypothetical protein
MQRPKKTKGELWRKIEELEQKLRILDDFCARNIEMRSASRKKTGSSHKKRYKRLIA